MSEAFIQNIDNKSEVNHKDGNTLNNNITNLEWCTSSENHKHAISNGLSKPPSRIGTSRVFKFIHISGDVFEGSVLELSRIHNIPHTSIYDIINHPDRCKQTKGWRLL